MSMKTRKRIWSMSLVMSIAIIGALAAFVVLEGNPGSTSAHGGDVMNHCDDLASHGGPFQNSGIRQHDRDAAASANPHTCADGSGNPDDTGNGSTGNGDDMMMMDGDVMISSSSTSGSATVELQLTVKLNRDVPVGGAFVLYLEDDYQEPDSISASDVYFVSTPSRLTTGMGSRVYATQAPEIDTDEHFTADKDDIDIRVSVPDMCTNATDACEGSNGLRSGDTVTMVIQKSAGIKNPSEAGTHSVGASILGPTASVGGPMYEGDMVETKAGDGILVTVAKISLSDVDNDRGYEMTVTGSGFNNGTSAAVHVMGHARYHVAKWWETLNCDQMKAAMNSDKNEFCFHYDLNMMDMTYMLNTSDGDRGGKPEFKALSEDDKKMYSDMVFDAHLCSTIIRDGHRAGIATVGSDDKVAVTFEVTVPIFVPGNNNYICMVDGEGRMSNTDVEDFNLQDSLRVVPSSASAGDVVNVFAQDFPSNSGGLQELKIANQVVWTPTMSSSAANYVSTKRDGINDDGSGTITFELPGSLNGVPLEGTVRIDVNYGGTKEDGKITITGSALRLSQGEVRANESITIQGEGFGGQTRIDPSDITIDGVPLYVDSESLDGGMVKVSNAGQFVATVAIWRDGDSGDNPSLISGTHTIRVKDSAGFFGTATIVVKEPSIKVLPLVAGPRDVITITGENWPVDNPDGGNVDSVEIEIDDDPNRDARTYTAIPDLTGRFTFEHRVSRDVGIPSNNQIKVTYGDNSEIVKISSFDVPESIIEVAPGEAQPGESISLTVSGMPVYTNVHSIEVGGRNVLGGQSFSTDRTGAATAEVIVPGLDPGTYSVIMEVGEEEHLTIAIGEVEVLAEGAIGTEVSAADGLANLGDNLVAVFHFNNAAKEWSFYDPRPEFADLNTLDNMVQGEAYWILVDEDVDEVVLNNKVRSLTCRGDDCWNLEVW